MRKLQPVVSVLMTAYNREHYIADAINSILASSFQDFELIIVDDCSSDRTVEVAQSFEALDERVKVYKNQENLGDYPNRNKAASYASGTYIKYFDSDDIMYPHCLQVMVNCMQKFPEAGYGLSATGDTNNPFPVCLNPREAYREHFFSGKDHFNRAPGSSIIRRDAFEKMGGFSGIRQVGDFEFWLKMGCYYYLVKMPVDLYWSRLHDNSESKVHDLKQKLDLKSNVIKKIFSEENVPLEETEKQKAIALFKRSLYPRLLHKLLFK